VKSFAASAVLHFKWMVALVAWNSAPLVQQFSQHPPSPILLGEIQEDFCTSQEANHTSHETNSTLQRSPPSPIPLEETPVPTTGSAELWLESTTLATLQKANANDVQCVSWILWNITDPDALDSAFKLAGTVR